MPGRGEPPETGPERHDPAGVFTAEFYGRLITRLQQLGCLRDLPREVQRDLMADAIALAWQRMHEDPGGRPWRDQSSLEGWLVRTIQNKAMTAKRDRARRDRILRSRQADLVGSEESRARRITDPDILALMERLTPAERVSFERKHLEGWSYREIAEDLDRAEGTIKSWVARATRKLRRLLGPRADEDPGGARRPR